MARPTRGGDIPAPSSPPAAAHSGLRADQGTDLGVLLGKAAAGDEQAWRELVRLYARRIFALARSRLRDTDLAEEVAQSVFVTVANKLKAGEGGYTEQGKFEPWLFRVAVNRIRDEVRRMKRQAATAGDESFERMHAAGSNGTPPSHQNEAALSSLRGALVQLSDADRQVIELRHHAGLSFAAMAELLEEPLGTLLARHHRALRKLKDLMSKNSPSVEEEMA